MTDTKAKLLKAAEETLRDAGINGLSARSIAAAAGVNQALIFYHFTSVTDLVVAATRQSVDDRVGVYRERFAAVTTLSELLLLGRRLHEDERENGNVATMAQLMAGGQQDGALAEASRYALTAWSAEIEIIIRRVLSRSPLSLIADPAGLARAVSASFIGLELYEGVDPSGAVAALDALERLAVLVEVMDDLGPVARRALQAKLRKGTRKPDTGV